MMKRTVAVLAALILTTGTASAATGPEWPCEVTVSIEAGPWHDAAVVAMHQVDDATAISWRLVDDRAMVSVTWGELDPAMPGFAWWYLGPDGDYAAAGIVMDTDHDPRWLKLGLLHEFGHVAGLDHNSDDRSVMNAKDVPWRSYQPIDLERLAAVTCH